MGNALPNIHPTTGMAYGVISANSINLWDVAEGTSPTPEETKTSHTCSECEHEFYPESWGTAECPNCQNVDEFDEGDELPTYWAIDREEVKAEFCESLNCWYVTESPVLAPTNGCSPCCPNAGDLDSPNTGDFPRWALALPEDWFGDDEPCPYKGLTKTLAEVQAL